MTLPITTLISLIPSGFGSSPGAVEAGVEPVDVDGLPPSPDDFNELVIGVAEVSGEIPLGGVAALE